MQLQKVIERLGYTAHEAKVYLAALSLGESHISDIAARVKLPRSSAQIIADRLHKSGLLSFYVRKRYKYWVAEKPVQLLARMEERGEEMRAVLPQLEALRRADHGKPLVKVYEGVDEIRLIYDDTLDSKSHIDGIVPWEEWVAMLGRGFLEDFIEKRMRQYLRFRLLIPKTSLAQEMRTRDGEELRETRYLPRDYNVKTTVLLYSTKVAIISLNKARPTAVVIDDAGTYETLQIFFADLWSRCSAQ